MAEIAFDLLVVGGGINGCGIARDAAGRGYRVLLCEARDLASGTSSSSTKLVHGGLRYLEHREFRLVREALREREVLWRLAPHIVWPLRFILPHHAGLRPAWLLRLGLFLYDHLGGRRLLPGTRDVSLRNSVFGRFIKSEFSRGFEYSDCWVEDSRLVVLNARSAQRHGADIRVRTAVTALHPDATGWSAEIVDAATGTRRTVKSRMVVNAAGPWVDKVLGTVVGRNDARNVRLVQGSHIVVRRLYDHDRCYIFQNSDGRIIFAIPYEQDFTLIGTTDRDYDGDPAHVEATEGEIAYLIAAANEYVRTPIQRSDVVWTYSGVRPLFGSHDGSAQEATRDYVLRLDGEGTAPRILNVFGGKITTFRRLAEAALQQIEGVLGVRGMPWTAAEELPGGDFPVDGYDALVTRLSAAHPGVDRRTVARLVRAYGTDSAAILGQDPGRDLGAGLTEAEVDYLVEHEWARTADDILWRRSKLGLRVAAEGRQALETYLDVRTRPAAAQ